MPWEPSVGDPVVRKRFGVSTGTPQTFTTAGVHTVDTPPPGRAIRLRWIGLSSPIGQPSTQVTVKIGSDTIYDWDVGMFAHGVVREGAVDAPLTVTLAADATVRVNFDREVF